MRTSTKIVVGVAAALAGAVAFGLSAAGASADEQHPLSNKPAKQKRNAKKAERVLLAEAP